MYPFIISTLEQREQFYKEEFDINKLGKWFVKYPQFFVIDLGTETRITTNEAKAGKLIALRSNINLKTLREKLIRYKPEDVYYDRNIYKDTGKCLKCLKFNGDCFNCDNFLGQQLAFDVDPENFKCALNHKKLTNLPSKHLNFCFNCFELAKQQSKELALLLKKQFKKIKIIYSGRGFHVHIFDEAAYHLSKQERSDINKKLKNFKIDPWVSQGKVRLIRLPYSLNALVSRIVLPLSLNTIENFDPLKNKKVIPNF